MKQTHDQHVDLSRNEKRQEDFQPFEKPFFIVAKIVEAFVNEKKAIEGLYIRVVRSLGRKDKRVKPNIVIPELVQPQMAEFSELVSDDILNR